MQAIVTKYLPATETKGARIKALADAKSITIPFPRGPKMDTPDAHRFAAEKLRDELGWEGELAQGWLPDQVRGWAYCFAFVGSRS